MIVLLDFFGMGLFSHCRVPSFKLGQKQLHHTAWIIRSAASEALECVLLLLIVPSWGGGTVRWGRVLAVHVRLWGQTVRPQPQPCHQPTGQVISIPCALVSLPIAWED